MVDPVSPPTPAVQTGTDASASAPVPSAVAPVEAPAPPPAPTITAIAPAEGPTTGGTVVSITGADLAGATGVKFGASPAVSFTVNSATSIVATAPPGADAADVVVTTPAGSSATGTKFKYVGTPVVVANRTTSTPVGNDGAVIPKIGTVLVSCPAGYGVDKHGYLSAVLPADAAIDDLVEVHAISDRENSGILVSLFPPIGESIGSRPVSTGTNSDAASAVTSDSGRMFRKVSATNWRGIGGGSN